MENETEHKKSAIWKTLKYWLTFWLIASVIGVFAILTGATGRGSSNTSSSDLHLEAVGNNVGIEITNLDSFGWQDCMVGVNGGTGWGFDNPPYQTRAPLSVPASSTVVVAYEKMSEEDGTIFDRSTHTVNTLVVDCFKGTTSERSWVGTLR